MTDLEFARSKLAGHSLVLCKNGETVISDKHGVAPMADFIGEGKTFSGYSAADRVVGKAAAMLFVKAEVSEVFAETLSKSAVKIFREHNIKFEYNILTDNIINREGNGPCPMENAVSKTDNIEDGVRVIQNTLEKMRSKNI